MSLLEIQWDQPKPTARKVQAMWKSLRFPPAPLESARQAAVDSVLENLRKSHTNGDAQFARFHLPDHPVLAWYSTRNRWDEIDFCTRFLRHPDVHQALPDVVENPVPQSGEIEFLEKTPFILAGSIAEEIYFGGAYSSNHIASREAMDLGEIFRGALLDSRFDEANCYVSYQPWSKWFHGIAWDSTWLILDKGTATVSLLCKTDTD